MEFTSLSTGLPITALQCYSQTPNPLTDCLHLASTGSWAAQVMPSQDAGSAWLAGRGKEEGKTIIMLAHSPPGTVYNWFFPRDIVVSNT